jgi:preprotein translocase subunit SecE
MKKLKAFIIECITEIRYKVTWPPYKELQNNSILVLVASLVFAAIIGLIDLCFRNAISWLYHSF